MAYSGGYAAGYAGAAAPSALESSSSFGEGGYGVESYAGSWDGGVTSFPLVSYHIAFASSPGDEPVWTDVSQDVLEDSAINRGRSSEFDKIRAGQLVFVLTNEDRKYDPTYTAGPYYPNIVPQRRVRVQAYYAGAVYDEFHGYVDSWQQQYMHPKNAVAVVSATDAFGVFSRVTLPSSVWVAELLADAPRLWYRLGEPQGSTTVENVGSYVGAEGVVSGSPTFGVDGLVTRDADTAMSNTGAMRILVSDPADPFPGGTSQPFSIEFIVKTSGDGFQHPAFVYGINAIGTGGRVDVGLSSTGRAYMVITSGTLQDSYESSVTITDNNPHHIVVTSTGAPGGGKVYVDGVDRTTVVVNAMTTHVIPTGEQFTLAGNLFNENDGFPGTLDEFAVYSSVLAAARVAAHADARATPWDDELSGQRVERILDVIQWPDTDRNIDAGTSELQAASPTGTVLTYLQKVEESEAGLLFIARDGKVRFRGRHAGFNQPSQATLGDAAAGGGELEYTALELDYSNTSIYNEAYVSRADGVVQHAEDATSVTAYGRRTLTIDGLLVTSDSEMLDRALFAVATYKDPVLRATKLVIQPAGGDEAALFPFVLNVEIGQRVLVRRRPQEVGSTLELAAIIEGIQHRWSDLFWQTDLLLSPTEADDFLQLDDTDGPGLGGVRLAY